jgi:hypothetical protein
VLKKSSTETTTLAYVSKCYYYGLQKA